MRRCVDERKKERRGGRGRGKASKKQENISRGKVVCDRWEKIFKKSERQEKKGGGKGRKEYLVNDVIPRTWTLLLNVEFEREEIVLLLIV